MQNRKLVVAMLSLLAAGTVCAEEYSILPVEGSVVTSADGSTMMVDVIDTDYKRGTFIISLVNESFESVIGDRVLVGNEPLDLTPVEVPAVSGMADVVAWNQANGDDWHNDPHGGTGRGHASGGNRPQWVPKVIESIIKYCKAVSRQAYLAIQVAQAACAASGGTHSGGSIGKCGIGADTGTCTPRATQVR